jgi:hypothetical protein
MRNIYWWRDEAMLDAGCWSKIPSLVGIIKENLLKTQYPETSIVLFTAQKLF